MHSLFMNAVALRTVCSSFAAVATLLLVGCGGGADVGSTCDTRGSVDECVESAVCDEDATGKVCLELCDSQDDCSEGFECNGVTGSNLKACHAKE